MLLDVLVSTFRSLRAHAMRFALTSLGIVWGAFLLIYLTSSMQGLDNHFRTEMEEIGPKIVIAWPGNIVKHRVGERGARQVELEHEDVVRVASLVSVDDAAPDVQIWSQIVRTGGRTKLFNVAGIGPRSAIIRNLTPAEGRFFTPTDVDRAARVVYLGRRAADALFDGRPAVGRTVQIESLRFRVIGVNEAKGDQMIGVNGWDDQTVFVPWSTAQRWLLKHDHITQLAFAPRSRETSPASIANVREIVGLHHDFPPDLDTAMHFFNIHDVLIIIDTIFLGFRIFLLSAGLITLLVGAIGVMNIMLVIVAERTGEIGLRKAVGASSRSIFVQFLAESTAVCAVSGIFGASLGVALTALVASIAPEEGPLSSPPVVEPWTVVLTLSALVTIGVLAGVVPAIRAARIPPAEALRAG